MKRSVLLLSSFAPALAAQVSPAEPPRGVFAAVGHALSVPAATGLSPKEIRIKTTGDKTTLPVQMVSPMANPLPPDYTMGAMFPTNPNIDIDAMSTGNDLLPISDVVNSSGEIESHLVPAISTWVAFTFSVHSGSTGELWSPVHARSSAAGNLKGPGGDLFSYTFPGSAVPQYLIGPRFEQAFDDLSLASIQTPEMDGHDIYISWLYESAALAAWAAPYLSRFYFSLSSSSAAQASVWGIPTQHCNGATIFSMQWNGISWSTPTVFMTRDSFGPIAQQADIDGLALDRSRDTYVVSFADGHGPNQFLAGTIPTSGGTSTPRSLRTASGDELWRRIGLIEGDRVDAICGFDPRLRAVPARAVGVPGLVGVDPLTAGSARGAVGGGVGEVVDLTMSGWVGAPVRSRVEFYVSVNGGPLVLLSTVSRGVRDMNVSVRVSGNRFTAGQQLTFRTRYVTPVDAYFANDTVMDW